jgi:glycosyl transferase family 2
MAETLRRRERAAAIIAPATVFLVGAITPSRRPARIATSGVIAASLVTPIVVAWAARRSAGSRTVVTGRPTRASRIHVLVPARDEAAVIGRLIADLGGQDLRDDDGRGPGFTLHVVDDRSTDGTGAIVAAAIAAAGLSTVATRSRRDDGPDGKGAALESIPLDGIEDDTIVLVLDADARLAPDALSTLLRVFACDPLAITARRRMLQPSDGHRAWLARWQDDEQTVDGAIQRARLELGGTGELRGNGMAIRARDLRAIGGWDATALTEDLEATTRLVAVRGMRVHWRPEVEIWEQPVLHATALVRQRLRWAEGAVRRDLRVTWPVVLAGHIPWQLRLDLATYAAQTLVPWLGLGLLARGNRTSARRALAVLVGAYLAGGALIAAGAFGRLDRRVPVVAAMGALWPVVLPLAWLRVAFSRGQLRFSKTAHEAGFSPPGGGDDRIVAAGRTRQGTVRSRATTRRGATAAGRSPRPADATDGRRPGNAVPTSRRTCP